MLYSAFEADMEIRLPGLLARLGSLIESDRDVLYIRNKPYAPDASLKAREQLQRYHAFQGLTIKDEEAVARIAIDFYVGRRHEVRHDGRAYMKELLGVLARTAIEGEFRQKSFISLSSKFLFFVFPGSTMLYDNFAREGLTRMQFALTGDGPKYIPIAPRFRSDINDRFGERYLPHYVAALHAEYVGFEAAALHCFTMLRPRLARALDEAPEPAVIEGLPYAGEALERRLFDLLLMDHGGRWGDRVSVLEEEAE